VLLLLELDLGGLMPEQPRRASRQLFLWHTFREAFGITDAIAARYSLSLGGSFELGGQAAHPYTEVEPPQRHPLPGSPLVPSVQDSMPSRADMPSVDAAMILGFAAMPPAPRGRWIERWVTERRLYHDTTIAALRNDRTTMPLEFFKPGSTHWGGCRVHCGRHLEESSLCRRWRSASCCLTSGGYGWR
jgi:hypothetical protein